MSITEECKVLECHMMLCDAHVHVGCFPRRNGNGERVFRFSPARIARDLRLVGVDEFIFSSTNAVWDSAAQSMHADAYEMRRLYGSAAHPFFWVSGSYLKTDRNLDRIPDIYQGLKLHGGETPWLRTPRELNRLLSIAAERNLPVQIHTSADSENHAKFYLPYCARFQNVRFDLAHVQSSEITLTVARYFQNVFIDVSFLPFEKAIVMAEIAPERVMYGSDIPAPMRYGALTNVAYMRRALTKLNGCSQHFFSGNFQSFLRG